jgi:hypothetical protein
LDVDNSPVAPSEGGSDLTISGTLANTGAVQIGSTSLTAATAVTLGRLTNSSGATFAPSRPACRLSQNRAGPCLAAR